MLLSLNADVSNKPAVKNLHLTNESGQGGSYIKVRHKFWYGIPGLDVNDFDY